MATFIEKKKMRSTVWKYWICHLVHNSNSVNKSINTNTDLGSAPSFYIFFIWSTLLCLLSLKLFAWSHKFCVNSFFSSSLLCVKLLKIQINCIQWFPIGNTLIYFLKELLKINQDMIPTYKKYVVFPPLGYISICSHID